MNFLFIAVNYNGSDFTKEYVESINSLKKDIGDNIDIIIVDNDSNEKDKKQLKLIKSGHTNLKVLWLEENVGYFRGLNKGITFNREHDYDYLIVGNNDLTFQKDFLSKLKQSEIDSNTLVIAPNIITKDGRKQNPHVINSVSTIEKFKVKIYYSNYYIGQIFKLINQNFFKKFAKPNPHKNEYGRMKIKRGIGACYVLTENFFKHFEKLDDRVFMWGEEALLSNQVESVDGITIYDPNIKIIHHESASVKKIDSKKKYFMVKDSYKIYKNYL